MRVSELGEFGLIRRIAGLLPPAPADVIVGIGDDVAVLDAGGGEYLLATCDVQVENVHFLRNSITPFQLGRKVAAINVSDIAAMGGTPSWALVSLALPPEMEVSFVDGLYEGLREMMREAGGAVVGGNLSKAAAEIVIDLCLLGRVAPDHLILRNGARPGDLILVTGLLGDSRAGLECILNPGLPVPAQSRAAVEARHLAPQPRLREGQALGRSMRVRAMADVSDGLVGDMGHICRASGAGAVIRAESLPVSAACGDVAAALGRSALDLALAGGEDYELLFTVAPESASQVRKMVEEETGTVCTVIGEVVPREAGLRVLLPGGGMVSVSELSASWDHFAGSAR
ncbi:MAG: thiamine-phosphate kinase [Syntrophobacteraceae bacterium]|nr:thiamine-phosphate kinase [Desulfobacteraceae bacterium]